MGFRTGYQATIWSVEDKGKYSTVKLSTSKKDKDGKYQTDFNGFVRFIGEAHRKAPVLKERDHIKIGEVDVSTSYNKEKRLSTTNYAMFSFEMVDGSKPAAAKPTAEPFGEDASEEMLPWM